MMKDELREHTEKIVSPVAKKRKLIKFLSKFECKAAARKKKDEESRPEKFDEAEIEVTALRGPAKLSIVLSKESFSLRFADWQMNYPATKECYKEMKKDLKAIMRGDKGVLLIYSSSRLLYTGFHEGFWEWRYDENILLTENIKTPELMEELEQCGGRIKLFYWSPHDEWQLDIPPCGEKSEYRYPQLYGVRFIVKGEKCFGNGQLRKYNSKLAFLKYIWVDKDLSGNLWMQRLEKLYTVLERDAIEGGYSEIFTLCDKKDKEEQEFYRSHGYVSVPNKKREKVDALSGCHIIRAMTMQKKLS